MSTNPKSRSVRLRRIYSRFATIFHGEPFVDFRLRGARVQRPLWKRGRALRLTQTDDDAMLAAAAALGLDLHAITEQLQADGMAAFAQSYGQMLNALDQKRHTLLTNP